MGLNNLPSESSDLFYLARKLKDIDEHLRQQLNSCYKYIGERNDIETYQIHLDLFNPKVIHNDNMEVVKALIYALDEKLPLLDGATKRRVSLDVLRRKNVLLLISSLEFSSDELKILEQIYKDTTVHQYEIVWIPIVDRPTFRLTDDMRTKFENLRSTMPWYSVDDLLLIQKPVISSREEALWREEKWRLELLVDHIPDPRILNWIKEDKYIFFYGGDDVEWVRRFAKEARKVATADKIPLEIVYVGKSSEREKVNKARKIISKEKLGDVLQDQAMVWFWNRLESLLFSKIQLGRADDDDPIVQQIKKLLSYDRGVGWAVLSIGSNIVVNAHSTTVLHALVHFEEWKVNVSEKGFHLAFQEYHGKLLYVPCSRLEFQTTTKVPDSMKCPECHHLMKKYATFLCCHDEHI
ncbi:hypothetical protein DITRI_Ditri09bG0017800 [Diplodiscus trichospermus]